MANKKQKFYVVWSGGTPGVYKTWAECQKHVQGVKGAKYKSFDSLREAEIAFKGNPAEYIVKKKAGEKPKQIYDPTVGLPIMNNSLAVDAACSGARGPMEYRGVWLENGQQLFIQGPYEDGTNNIGEFLGIVHALAYLKQHKYDQTIVYTDSRTAMKWVREKKIKTTLEKNNKNAQLFDMIDRAIKWLETNTYMNPIRKWETKHWGEIPADFGRK
ncbi:ribonuclease H family protein [Flammeovirga yaeyamensis]|uniref:Ribonuclease H n=1 Tax=Flammeovirga yaeyamensis TaxID=367791 RepID=A0AAX1N5N5_9BACT|nr:MULTISPECIES: ribonuclease H family protein [Flammeovirga]ANQ49694.1 ribonuclease H [Flammeovirga sp. MY04]MBB3697447.1 ribonuclease HI [Flammeovirga yaeyamensis]NMF36141.1 ribonuclease H [Flammeovirga yaeyamensis]QWG02874.1 ribonuclease H family protein [Flammeovirga yaeyamensis]